MAELLVNYWGWWIWDDSFLNRTGECLDMQWIDIRTSPRFIRANGSEKGSYASTIYTGTDTLNFVSEAWNTIAYSFSTKAIVNTTTAVNAGSDIHCSVGTSNDAYNATTNPAWLRHFFFMSSFATIEVANYDWTSTTSINSAAILQKETTAVCYLWDGAMIFARQNFIYEVNPSALTLNTTAKVKLTQGAIVKYITYYNWLIQFVYTIGNDTYIQGCTYDWTTYTLNTYSDKTRWYKCISAVSDAWVIYWVSSGWVHMFSGQSQLVKKLSEDYSWQIDTFSDSTRVSYNKWLLKIVDVNYYYEYGSTKPWYNSSLTKKSLTTNTYWVTENYIYTYTNGSNLWKVDNIETSLFKRTNTYYFHPYTAGEFWYKKEGTGVRIWYSLPVVWSETTVAWITISILTDDMERASASYLDIVTITDESKTSYDLMSTTIAKALWDAGYNNQYWYIKFAITLLAGNPQVAYWNTLYSKTPTVYDFHIFHDEILNSF